MRSSITIAVAVLATFASAQTQSTSGIASSTVSQSMPPAATAGFSTNGVDPALAQSWCLAQLNTCPEICGGTILNNQCSSTSFTYSCICSNGTAPDCTAYENTLPFFICQETFSQCIAAHPNDLDGQQTCTTNEKCGTLNATVTTSSSSSSAPSSTSSSSTLSSATATSASASSASASATSSSKSGAVRTEFATGAFIGLLFAACKLFL